MSVPPQDREREDVQHVHLRNVGCRCRRHQPPPPLVPHLDRPIHLVVERVVFIPRVMVRPRGCVLGIIGEGSPRRRIVAPVVTGNVRTEPHQIVPPADIVHDSQECVQIRSKSGRFAVMRTHVRQQERPSLGRIGVRSRPGEAVRSSAVGGSRTDPHPRRRIAPLVVETIVPREGQFEFEIVGEGARMSGGPRPPECVGRILGKVQQFPQTLHVLIREAVPHEE
mmetsp:Transcript_59938/g.177729  ORF Transcript_59938/g.177729 Transcript_59938/m.177729 type:complete len:224 (-) Transcript_59938:614-1285(-)